MIGPIAFVKSQIALDSVIAVLFSKVMLLFYGSGYTFILSLKAGGTGLNLTAASNVVHYDLWWNPAVEAQAYRIGQQKNVMVWRLITQGTFEQKIDEMIRRKKDLVNLTVATGESWIGNLTNEELGMLVGLG